MDHIVTLTFENTVDYLAVRIAVLEAIFEDILEQDDIADFYVATITAINET